MRVVLNGESVELRNGITVSELVSELKLTARRIAVEINQNILSKESFASHRLTEGDIIEIVHFIGGG